MDIKCAISGVGSIFNPLESADVQSPREQLWAASEGRVLSLLATGMGNAAVARTRLSPGEEGD